MGEEDHLYTWERIYHFSCGNCKNWWSYATAEDSYRWKSRKMSCPHCNQLSTVRPNPEMSKKVQWQKNLDQYMVV